VTEQYRPLKILCVHQGVELYGSDRSFLQSVLILREICPNAEIVVRLPGDGPLREAFEEQEFSPVIGGMWIIRKSHGVLGLALRLPGLLVDIVKAACEIKKHDITYINTAVVLNYIAAARISPERVAIHIRELPVGVAAMVFGGLVRFSKAAIFFNSKATGEQFRLPQSQKSAVIHNGFARPARSAPPAITADRPLRVALLGRINAWKGQDLLVEAVSLLPPDLRSRIEVAIIGGVFEGQPFDVALLRTIHELGLVDVVKIEPFVDDPLSWYEWCDLAVVPSRKPEPFGRVAIEAMAHSRAVIAAAHGGLLEIVEPGSTGWLFEPNSAQDLADILVEAIKDRAEVARRGVSAQAAFERHFTEEALAERFGEALSSAFPALKLVMKSDLRDAG